MKNLLTSIEMGSPLFEVETVSGGWAIVPKPGQEAAFTQMIEDIVSGPTDEFAIFPMSDGKTGYSRAVILPL
jgi:hypothetical protein